MPKAKSKKTETKIEDVDCIIKTTHSGKGLLVKWEGDTYITNVDFLSQLIDGKLTKVDGSKAKAVSLGLLTSDGIKETELFLTMKGKSLYFSPEEDVLLIVPVSNVKSVLEGKETQTTMGKFV